MSWIGGLIVILIILGPIIVNAQPGAKFYWLGIDWKADNLDNTLFWIGIGIAILASIGYGYVQKEKKLGKNLDAEL